MAVDQSNIQFTNKILSALTDALEEEQYSKIFVLTDENTHRYCLALIDEALPNQYIEISISSGEENKTLDTCTAIWQTLTDNHADRHALLINLGGGVICDMGGFCARTYKRGIRFWNVPTTVLSQVDASVGGKLGVDFGVFKNHIGLFSEPDLVFIDPVFFKTLPDDQVTSGFAEMIKHCLIRDRAGFERLKQTEIKKLDWQYWIPNSVKIKKAVVEEDPHEKGLRKILNFGHTIGHAVESFYLGTDKALKHGEAIAIGMIAEIYLSVKNCELTQATANNIISYLLKTFPVQIIKEQEVSEIVKLASHDKKNKAGRINAVLLNDIGNPTIDSVITEDEIQEALNYYISLTTK
jgi:3-dehydroquinate synthase